MADKNQEIQDLIAAVQTEAKAQAAGEDGAHLRLLGATEKLRLAVESPAEWHMRFRFQVGLYHKCPRSSIMSEGHLPSRIEHPQ
jgi:hypothetical protein